MVVALKDSEKSNVMRFLRYFFLALALGLIGICGWWWGYHVAKRDFVRLLRGDNSLALVAVDFEGHGLRIHVDDPASVSYLSIMLRSASEGANELGITYNMKLCLSTGGSVKCGLYLPELTNRLIILFPIDEGGDGSMYTVELKEPIPKALTGIISLLKAQ